jgi:hypothetical protein
MLALPEPLRSIAAKAPGAPGRPAVAEPRNCVAATRLTAAEYEGLIQLSGRDSISDLVRELLSEAVIARQLRRPSAASA